MTNYKKNFYFALAIGIMACAALSFYAYKKSRALATRDLQILAITDTLTLYKTKDGKNAAYTRVLEGTKKELLAITEKQNKRVYELLKTKGLRSLTTHSVTTKTDTTVIIDTLRLATNSSPLYLSKNIINKYYDAEITVKGDSVTLKHTSYNDFDYILQNKPASGIFGFLKPTSYVVQAINLNPNTQTRELRTLEIKPKSKVGVKLTAVAVIIAGVLLVR